MLKIRPICFIFQLTSKVGVRSSWTSLKRLFHIDCAISEKFLQIQGGTHWWIDVGTNVLLFKPGWEVFFFCPPWKALFIEKKTSELLFQCGSVIFPWGWKFTTDCYVLNPSDLEQKPYLDRFLFQVAWQLWAGGCLIFSMFTF